MSSGHISAQQLLEILREIRASRPKTSRDIRRIRIEAVKKVSLRRNVYRNTVADKYIRHLTGGTRAFDDLVNGWLFPSGSDLQQRMENQYADDRDAIRKFFSGLTT
jgi:hypothetical protein